MVGIQEPTEAWDVHDGDGGLPPAKDHPMIKKIFRGRLTATAVAGTLAGLILAGCADSELMRAYRTDNNQATDKYKAAVANFAAAVHSASSDRLTELSDSEGTTDGIGELLARYGSAVLTLLSYDLDHPGEAGATFTVRCTGGGRAIFTQAFRGVDGQWRPEILGTVARTAEPPRPDEALTNVPAPAGSTSPTPLPTVTLYDFYPPCSTALASVPTN